MILEDFKTESKNFYVAHSIWVYFGVDISRCSMFAKALVVEQ